MTDYKQYVDWQQFMDYQKYMSGGKSGPQTTGWVERCRKGWMWISVQHEAREGTHYLLFLVRRRPTCGQSIESYPMWWTLESRIAIVLRVASAKLKHMFNFRDKIPETYGFVVLCS